MSYKIKEIYYTLQGEGYHTGRAAVFCRFTGCNLWTGREKDRAKAICQFCDTDFVGMDGELGGKYTSEELVARILSVWPDSEVPCFVVFTGGEPGLQLDKELIDDLHMAGCYIAIETNGTVELPKDIDWICVSPKANSDLIIKEGHELKLVYPQVNLSPEMFENMAYNHFYLQPLDDINAKENTLKAVEYCHRHPLWKLSIQTHKILGIQ